jgi:hypothetical protein
MDKISLHSCIKDEIESLLKISTSSITFPFEYPTPQSVNKAQVLPINKSAIRNLQSAI